MLIFFAIIFALDRIGGVVFPFLVEHAKSGHNARSNYICNQTNEDILVFGSSRARHHYNAQMIEDSMGLSCYNCGQNGNGAILNYGRLLMATERYIPKMIIYDLSPTFDLLQGDANQKYLGWLKPYYDRNGISQIFNSVDSTENIKMQSYFYRYNSRFVEIASDYIHPGQPLGIKGFTPLHADKSGRLGQFKKVSSEDKPKEYKYDSLKLQYLDKIAKLNSKTKVVFVISPSWYGMDSLQFVPIKTMSKKNNIDFYDFSNLPKYVHNYEYFKDGTHLNAKGADEFTKDLIKVLKRD